MQEVYRLEVIRDGETNGVYNHSNRTVAITALIGKWMKEYNGFPHERPTYAHDFDTFDIKNIENYCFGCDSLESLKEWFDFEDAQIFSELCKKRYVKIVKYRTDEVIISRSKTQVIFLQEKAQKEILKIKDVFQTLEIN